MIWGRRCFFGYTVSPDGEIWWFANPPAKRELISGELTEPKALQASPRPPALCRPRPRRRNRGRHERRRCPRRQPVRELDPPPYVVMVTTFDDDGKLYEALRTGASGFLLKNSPPEQLVEAVCAVAAGEGLLSTVAMPPRPRALDDVTPSVPAATPTGTRCK